MSKHFLIFHCENTDACQKYQGENVASFKSDSLVQQMLSPMFYFLSMQLVLNFLFSTR